MKGIHIIVITSKQAYGAMTRGKNSNPGNALSDYAKTFNS
jgi:hypothetical protein